MSIPVSETYENEDTFVSHTGPLRLQRPTQFEHMSGPLYSNQRAEKPTWTKLGKQNSIAHAIMPEEIRRNDWSYHNDIGRNEHLLKSGPLGLCNNPDCTDCPAAYKKTKRHYYGSPASLDSKLHNLLYGDVDGWAKKSLSYLASYFPIMNPHTKVVQQWNKFFVISCLVAIFIDPLFFFLLSVGA
ncbi:putative cyclic nucleotide-gated ion channel 20, chloroplastic, partial [Ananas comosus]